MRIGKRYFLGTIARDGKRKIADNTVKVPVNIVVLVGFGTVDVLRAKGHEGETIFYTVIVKLSQSY